MVLLNIQTTSGQSTVSAEIPSDQCGQYITVSSGESGTISSPFYPDNYPDKALCIWLLRASVNFKFEVNVPAMNGEAGDGVNATCRDFLEVKSTFLHALHSKIDGNLLQPSPQIRSGSSTERLDYLECDSSDDVTFRTKSRWLWIRFKSDAETNNTGFELNYSLVEDDGEIKT